MKAELRQKMLSLRQSISTQQAARLNRTIEEKLLALPVIQNSKSIMAYSAFKSEVDLSGFIERCQNQDKKIYLPRIEGSGIMQAVLHEKGAKLETNRYGIPEPQAGAEAADMLDVIIVPAVVIDEKLCRIGYGGGYYDRFLERSSALRIGVCYDFQIVKALPKESHDVCMDIVISEKRTLGAVN